MTFWGLWFVWTSVADWATTLLSLQAGAQEGNPIMGWLTDYPMVFLFVKLVVPGAIVFYLWDKGRTGKAIMALGGLAFAIASINNLIQAGII